MSATCNKESSKRENEEPHLWEKQPDYNDDSRRNANADQVVLPADTREASRSTLQQS
jgi:hypothetical protein